jgi:ABC-type transport system involved in multi-copper enzyme maturation permease subunit
MNMKYGFFIILFVLGFLMVPSSVFALDDSSKESTSFISTMALENSYVEVQAKSSSSGSSSSSSSSSKTKIKGDGDDDTTGDTSTGIPWWIFLVIGGVILLIIIIAIWYFFLRK